MPLKNKFCTTTSATLEQRSRAQKLNFASGRNRHNVLGAGEVMTYRSLTSLLPTIEPTIAAALTACTLQDLNHKTELVRYKLGRPDVSGSGYVNCMSVFSACIRRPACIPFAVDGCSRTRPRRLPSCLHLLVLLRPCSHFVWWLLWRLRRLRRRRC